jgi:hypothetical protein
MWTTAEERYQDMVKENCDILQRVPQAYIASYLGITPESLSRIRKKKAEFWNSPNSKLVAPSFLNIHQVFAPIRGGNFVPSTRESDIRPKKEL